MASVQSITSKGATVTTGRPFWSVMIPTFNPKKEFLAATLRSVLSQDPGSDSMQIEVIDDCSPLGAPIDLVKELAGERVQVHCEQSNLGLAEIWNRCIARARGEWVHILHQDDLVYPGFYDSLRAGIAECENVGAAFTRHAYCDEAGTTQRISELELPKGGTYENFLSRITEENRLVCASMVVKKSTYTELGGYDPRLTHALDWEMWIRIANAFPVFYHPQVLAAWRNHSNATTTRQIRSGENIRDIAHAIKIWRRYLPKQFASEYARRAQERYSSVSLDFARYFLAQGELVAAYNQLSATLRLSASRQTLSAAGAIALGMAKDILFRIRRRLSGASRGLTSKTGDVS